MDYPVHEILSPWNSPDQNAGVGSLSLLQGIFPTQGLNPGLSHCRLILYQLSHKGSPRILEWVAYPFSNGSSWSRNWTRVSCIAGGFLPTELSGKPIIYIAFGQMPVMVHTSMFVFFSKIQGLGTYSTWEPHKSWSKRKMFAGHVKNLFAVDWLALGAAKKWVAQVDGDAHKGWGPVLSGWEHVRVNFQQI